jgi:DNA-directed RNA polymerase specialized sigma24 family protein
MLMNTTTIQYMNDNYNRIIKILCKLGSREDIEDAISDLYVTLLRKEYSIDNPMQFISGAVRNSIFNRHRRNRRLVSIVEVSDGLLTTLMEEDSALVQRLASPCIIEQIIENQDLNSRLRLMREKIQELTRGQKLAITNFLKYGKTSLVPGNANTNKANFRWATLALKDKLCLS